MAPYPCLYFVETPTRHPLDAGRVGRRATGIRGRCIHTSEGDVDRCGLALGGESVMLGRCTSIRRRREKTNRLGRVRLLRQMTQRPPGLLSLFKRE
jgi:hypothetical protein